MRKLSKQCAAMVWGMVVVGCASSGSTPPPDVPGPEPAEPPIAQPGDEYLMYYADRAGIRIRNSGAVVDSVVVAGARDIRAKGSPDNGAVAVAYYEAGTSHLTMVDPAAGSMSTVHSAPGRGTYTFAWAPGSDALGAGYRPAGGGRGTVVIADRNGNVRNVGCSTSNRFIAWRSGGQIVVGDGRNIYTVDARDCRTLATLPMSGKTDITYSPDGTRIFFKRGNSLFIADYNGTNTKRIVAARSRPTNMRWSPDGRKIAFEIASPRYADITHVAVYDYTTDQVTFNAEEQSLGVPTEQNPCWSPDGARLSIDRSYARRGESGAYVQRQKIVTPVTRESETVVTEELIRGTRPDTSRLCAWIDDRHLALSSADGPRIFNVETKVAYRLPDDAKLLYARVLQ